MASETHFPLARVLECPRQSWLDQDDGRIGPDHSSDLVSGTGIPQLGPCDCQGSLTMCPLLTLLLTTMSLSPSVVNGARDGAIQRDRFFTVVCPQEIGSKYGSLCLVEAGIGCRGRVQGCQGCQDADPISCDEPPGSG